MDDNDLHLYFDHSGMNPFEYNHIVFKNAKVKTQEHELSGCYFIYYEIYRLDLGYEMHMLLWYQDTKTVYKYAYFTVFCEDIVTDTVAREKKWDDLSITLII